MGGNEKIGEAGESLVDSFRSHLAERSKSPFAGAFLLAWFAVNWEAVLTLLLSTRDIEERIEYVRGALSSVTAIWLPVVVSLGVMAGFYVGSLAVSLLRHFYDLARGFVSRRFEGRGWIERSTHLEMKRGYLQRIEEAERLAASNKKEILEEKEKAVELTRQVEEAARELDMVRESLLRKESELTDLEKRRRAAEDYVDVVRGMLLVTQENNEKLSRAVSGLLDPISEVRSNAQLIEARLQQGSSFFGPVPTARPDEPTSGLRRLMAEPKKSQFAYDQHAVEEMLQAATAVEIVSRNSQSRIADVLSSLG